MVEKYTIVADQLRAKYELVFYAHFANFINELLYENIYTLHRVQTKDLLHRVSDLEHMTMYVDEENRKEEESLIAFHAQLFESPLRITTEMPLMILTNTRDIFMRRKKYMRKLITEDGSYSDSSSPASQPILNQQSTVMMLEQSLSNLTFMNLTSSLNSYYSLSGADIYSPPSSLMQEKETKMPFKLNHSQSLQIRQLVESQVRHLIVQFHSKQSSQTHESFKSKRDNLQDFSEQAKDVSYHEVRISHESNRQIQSVVKAELKRYNIGQTIQLSPHNSSSRVSKTKKRVRDKAEQLLRNIRSSTII